MTNAVRSPITTHVLDLSRGKPAAGIPVLLELGLVSGDPDAQLWKPIGKGETDSDGRVATLLPPGSPIAESTYRLTFQTAAYFKKHGVSGFYPYVQIVFDAADASQHYHVPLLLSPHGYSTYRGS
ncbi:MAG: hydroxyisourate hydrolase [Deltaproteobacteria bacterium]|nr:hydroxyisourate hydrolase [Deltaproteobacteria bacterium]